MGRPRSFDEPTVVEAATRVFLKRGFEATSIEDLMTACGLHRGSLYKAFASKRGIFLAALERMVHELPESALTPDELATADTLDLLLIASVELAPNDREVGELVRRACAVLAEQDHPGRHEQPAELLGRRLLVRAGIPDPSQ